MLNEKEGKDKFLEVYKLAKKLFSNRRKTIYNNLSNYLNDKIKAENVLNKLNVPLNKRPEELSPEIFVRIYEITK